ncbi:MAG: hypothetical protein Q4Q53_08465, partial [Methanocorpusculum sp.]|nr:hypothetical protein [Methanocorpusculum sp.]
MKMNKTIIAVLAVFLVLAAFVGATSAAQVIYPYTEVKDLAGGKAIYLLEDPTKVIIANASGFIMTSDFTKGIYKLVSASSGSENKEYYLTNPDATIKIYLTGTTSSVVGKTVSTSSGLDFIVIPTRNAEVDNFTKAASSLWFTTPDGGKTSYFGLADSKYSSPTDYTKLGYWEATNRFTVPSIAKTDATPGTWSVQLKYNAKAIAGADSTKIGTTSVTAYKFTIATTTDSITANKDSITRGNSVLVTVSGTPDNFAIVDINKDGFYLVPGQSSVQYLANYTLGSSYNDTITTLLNDSKVDVAYDYNNWTNFSANQIIVKIGSSGSTTF